MPTLAVEAIVVAEWVAAWPGLGHPASSGTAVVTENEEPRVNKLRDLVLSRLEELGPVGEPMSAREAARRSGNHVSYGTLHKIVNGTHSGRLRDSVVEGIATALEVPVARVYEAAGIPAPQGRWRLPPRFDRVPIKHRRMFEDLIGVYLDVEEQGYERGRSDAQSQ